jgi:hypothetical protein
MLTVRRLANDLSSAMHSMVQRHRPALTHFPTVDQVDNVTGASLTDLPTSTEWLRGEELCTVSGRYVTFVAP